MNNKKSFTMAEILIAFTIVGIVAILTIPSVLENFEKKEWKARKKAFYSRMSQAIDMMPKLTGYGTYSSEWDSENSSLNVIEDTAAMAFITDGLSKVMTIKQVCDSDELKKCGLPDKIWRMPPTKPRWGEASIQLNFPKTIGELNSRFIVSNISGYSPMNTKTAAFETVNGESVAVFYNPFCQMDLKEKGSYSVMNKMCVNFIYDVNGLDQPNTVGDDVGIITVLYSVMPKVVHSPNAASRSGPCSDFGKDFRSPNIDELALIAINRTFFPLMWWTYEAYNSSTGKWVMNLDNTLRYQVNNPGNVPSYCIKTK